MHYSPKHSTTSMQKSEEKFLNFSDAAKLIGYRSYTKITEFVNTGVINSYSIPLSERKRVKKSDLVRLVFESSLQKPSS